MECCRAAAVPSAGAGRHVALHVDVMTSFAQPRHAGTGYGDKGPAGGRTALVVANERIGAASVHREVGIGDHAGGVAVNRAGEIEIDLLVAPSQEAADVRHVDVLETRGDARRSIDCLTYHHPLHTLEPGNTITVVGGIADRRRARRSRGENLPD